MKRLFTKLRNKCPFSCETMSQFTELVIPDESASGGRDPWFDRLTTLSQTEGLTTLSEVEGESSESSI